MKKLAALLLALILVLSCAAPALADKVRIKEGSNPNVRSLPSTDGDIVEHARSGQTYEMLDKSDNWYKIKMSDGTIGWISGGMVDEVIKEQAPEKAETAQPAAAAATPAPAAQTAPTPQPQEIAAAQVPAESKVISRAALQRRESFTVYDENGIKILLTEISDGLNKYHEEGFTLNFSITNDTDKYVSIIVDNFTVDGTSFESYEQGHALSHDTSSPSIAASPWGINGHAPLLDDINILTFDLSIETGREEPGDMPHSTRLIPEGAPISLGSFVFDTTPLEPTVIGPVPLGGAPETPYDLMEEEGVRISLLSAVVESSTDEYPLVLKMSIINDSETVVNVGLSQVKVDGRKVRYRSNPRPDLIPGDGKYGAEYVFILYGIEGPLAESPERAEFFIQVTDLVSNPRKSLCYVGPFQVNFVQE